MKNVIVFLTFLFLTNFVKAQVGYPIKQGVANQDSTIAVMNAVKARAGFVQAIYVDTVAANLTRIKQNPAAVIFTSNDNITWTRNYAATQWITYSVTTSTGCNNNTPFSGGHVAWNRLLKFDINPATYYIGCKQYNSNTDSVTLTAADVTNPRIDVIALDTTGHAVIITGTPNANPATPQINPASQVYLTSVLIPANATTPSGVSNELIYDENVEWLGATVGMGVTDFADLQHPYSLLKDVILRPFTNGNVLAWNRGTTININDYQTLILHIRLKGIVPSPNTASIQAVWYQTSGDRQVSIPVKIDNKYGFSKLVLNTYQTIIIPVKDFAPFSTSSVNQIKFIFSGSNSDSMFVDLVALQTGVINGGGGGTDVPVVGANNGDTLINNNIGLGGDVIRNTSITSGASKYLDFALADLRASALTYNADPNLRTIFIDTANGGRLYKQNINFTIRNGGQTSSVGDSLFTVVSANEIYFSRITGQNGITVSKGSDSLIVSKLGSTSATGAAFTANTYLYGASAYTLLLNNLRFENDYGASIAAANNLTLGLDGNVFPISGATQINAITTANWQAGSTVQLIFASTPTVKNNTAGGAGTSVILLAGSVDFVAAANDVLSLVYDGTSWHETARKVSAAGSALLSVNNGLVVSSAGKVGLDSNGVNPLTRNVLINGTANYQVAFTSAQTGSPTVLATNTSSGTALQGTGASGTGVYGLSASGPGIGGYSTSGTGGSFIINPSDASTSIELIHLQRETSGTAADGIGSYTAVWTKTTGGTIQESARFLTKLTTANTATNTAQYEIYLKTAGVLQQNLTLKGSGALQLNRYGSGTFTGTPTYTLQVDASGNIIEGSVSGVYTASNGLTMSANNTVLGGTLTGNTTINTGGFTTTFTGVNTADVLDVTTTSGSGVAIKGTGGSGRGLYGITNDGFAVYALANTSGYAVFATAGTGVGLYGFSTSGLAGQLASTPASTNTVISLLEIDRASSGTPADGMGSSIDMYLNSSTGVSRLSNQFISKWTTAANATRTSQFTITKVLNAVTSDGFILKGSGVINIPTDPPSYATNALALAGGLVVGDIYRNGDIVQIVH